MASLPQVMLNVRVFVCVRACVCVGGGAGACACIFYIFCFGVVVVEGVHGNFVHVFNSSMKCTHLGLISERALYNPTIILIIISSSVSLLHGNNALQAKVPVQLKPQTVSNEGPWCAPMQSVLQGSTQWSWSWVSPAVLSAVGGTGHWREPNT